MRPLPKDKRGSRWTGLGGCLGQLGDELFAGGPAVLGNPGQGAVDNRSFGACQHTQVRFGTNISWDELRRAVCERKPVPAQDAIGDRQITGPERWPGESDWPASKTCYHFLCSFRLSLLGFARTHLCRTPKPFLP